MRHGMDGRGCGPSGGGWHQFAHAMRAAGEAMRDTRGRGGWGGWGDGFGGPRGGGGRGRRMFDGGELRLLLLKLIGEEPRHGYDLIRTIEEMTGGGYAPSPGVVYPTLTMLDEQGLIEEQRSEGAKKRFAVTEEGRALLAANAEAIAALVARLEGLGGERERSHGGPTRRAMANLHMALRDRLGAGDLSADALHDVAAMIDDLARQIERLA